MLKTEENKMERDGMVGKRSVGELKDSFLYVFLLRWLFSFSSPNPNEESGCLGKVFVRLLCARQDCYIMI